MAGENAAAQFQKFEPAGHPAPLETGTNISIFEYYNILMENHMTLENAIQAFAGVMVLLSVALTVWVSPHFIWLTVFVGANLTQSAFTGFCPAALVFRALGFKSATAS